jgi:hypothetical protein
VAIKAPVMAGILVAMLKLIGAIGAFWCCWSLVAILIVAATPALRKSTPAQHSAV